MGTVNINKTGLVFGLFLGAWHFLWSLLVAMQWAQPVIDFIFWIHFIRPVYVVEAFDFTRAIGLVLVTSVVGYAIGICLGVLWNRFHKIPSD